MDTEMSGKPIVVGVDGSRFSRKALRWGLDEAARRDCAVRALMVVKVSPAVAAGRPTAGLGSVLPEGLSHEYLRLLETLVHGVVRERDDRRLNAELVGGSAPEVLCDATEDAQLLVLGSHGHGQLFEAVLGSVSRYCVRHASCPVVVIPAQLAEHAEDVQPAAQAAGPQPLRYTPGPLL